MSDVSYDGWLRHHGLVKPGLELTQFEPTNERGVRAMYSFASGAELLRIPRQLLLTPNVARRHLRMCTCLTVEHTLPVGQSLLTLLLFHEHLLGDKSSWHNYLFSLPSMKSFEHFPLHWSASDMDFIPAVLSCRLLKQQHTLVKDFDECVDMLNRITAAHTSIQLTKHHIWSTFQWLWLCVNTRCIYCDLHNGEAVADKVTLVPFLDMLNHNSSVKARCEFCTSDQMLVLFTDTPYAPNDQIFINYGPHDNVSLLIEYGFVLSENDQDCLMFSLMDISNALQWSQQACERFFHLLNLVDDIHWPYKELNFSSDGPSYFLTLVLSFGGEILSIEEFKLQSFYSKDEHFLQIETASLLHRLLDYKTREFEKLLQDLADIVKWRNLKSLLTCWLQLIKKVES